MTHSPESGADLRKQACFSRAARCRDRSSQLGAVASYVGVEVDLSAGAADALFGCAHWTKLEQVFEDLLMSSDARFPSTAVERPGQSYGVDRGSPHGRGYCFAMLTNPQVLP